MLLTDIREAKIMLDIDPNDTTQDKKVLLFCEWSSAIIENFIGRDLSYKTRTEFYQGTGTQKLLLKKRPVFPNPPSPYAQLTVFYDTGGAFGTAPGAFSATDGTNIPLQYGVDYTLQIDQDNGSSRSAILWRLNDYWNLPQVRQVGLLSPFLGPDPGSYKITYTAGWTIDTLPSAFRAAVNILIARLNFLFPYGVMTSSESYEERSLSYLVEEDLLKLVKHLLFYYRNWSF